MQTLPTILFALAFPQTIQLPPGTENGDSLPINQIVIKDIVDGGLTLPGTMKWSIEMVKTDVGTKIRVTSEDLIIEASQVQVKATAKAGEPIHITGLEKPVITLKSPKNFRYESVKTQNGPRIRLTINDAISLDMTQAVIEDFRENNKRITTLKLPDMIPITIDAQLLPIADTKPKRP